MTRILIVDDEAQIVRCLARLLTRRGYEVATAGSGAEALAKLASFDPDLVISDFRMPSMTGAELLAEVKRRLPLTARVILSGYADLNSTLASVNEGEVCRFLRKPWDDEELLGQIHKLLEDRRVMAELYRPFQRAGLAASARQDTSRIVVETKLSGETFSADQAVAIIARFTGVLAEADLHLVGGLLERHAGRIAFTAEVGGDQKLTLELPMKPGTAVSKAS